MADAVAYTLLAAIVIVALSAAGYGAWRRKGFDWWCGLAAGLATAGIVWMASMVVAAMAIYG